MQKELVTLFARVHVHVADGNYVAPKHVVALNTEAASFGYTFDAALLRQLKRMSKDDFAVLRTSLLRALGEVSGGSVRHAALFNRFPYETPDQWDYLLRRVIGYVQTAYGLRPNQAQVLSCGHVVDLRLFDRDDFSACPVCQFQVDELAPRENVQHAFQRLTPLKVLSPANDAFVRDKANALLARQGSLSAAERAFLSSARTLGGLERPSTVYRENLPFVYAFFADIEYVKGLLSGATDVLRIAAYLSNPDADLSLKEPVKFKLSTKHRKNLLRLLESRDDIGEDLLRWRERWVHLGEILNPGTAANRRRFPKTAAAFDRLRNAPQEIESFNRVVEHTIRARRVDAKLLRTLSARPAEFLRRLDVLLRLSDDSAPALKALRDVATRAPTKLIFELRKYLARRRTFAGPRVFIPKGQVNKLQVVEDRRAPIAQDVLDKAETILAGELTRRFAALPAMGRVYVDPALKDVVLPFNRRGDSATNIAVVKGSRYTLAASEIVRLFVWWKAETDVDLSIVCYGEDFDLIEQISWTNTRGFACVHSGDVQNAPQGASEFIDFDIADLRAHGVRYVVPSVISYRGETFDGFPCFAGFMERDALKSGRKYEPESVALKFDIKAKTTSHLPLIFDLEARQAIFADIASSTRLYATAAGSDKKLVATAQAVLALRETKPTTFDVLTAHAAARGCLVETPEEADLVFSRDTLDLEKVVAMLA